MHKSHIFNDLSLKVLTFFTGCIIASVIAGLYGIVHDQITFTISPEYYTEFKFIQFGITNLPERMAVGIIGFQATWWMGLFAGIILGIASFSHNNARLGFLISIRAFLYGLAIAMLVAILGGLIVWYISVFWKEFILEEVILIPPHVTNPRSFFIVGMIHNLSYLGGILAIIVGIFIHAREKVRESKQIDR